MSAVEVIPSCDLCIKYKCYFGVGDNMAARVMPILCLLQVFSVFNVETGCKLNKAC